MKPIDTLFAHKKALIGVIHLPALPGAPLYDGDMQAIVEFALRDAKALIEGGVNSLIIENFNDKPFFPDKVPIETVAAMATLSQEVVRMSTVPVGINVLRNDGPAAMAIATASQAAYIRVNVHMNAVVADQGIIQGNGYQTMRLRSQLKADNVKVFADVGVKHATPLVERGLITETQDVTKRGIADAVIVSGSRTGASTDLDELRTVSEHTHLPILIGSGVTPDNIEALSQYATGFIVGTYCKEKGEVHRPVDPERVRKLSKIISSI